MAERKKTDKKKDGRQGDGREEEMNQKKPDELLGKAEGNGEGGP